MYTLKLYAGESIDIGIQKYLKKYMLLFALKDDQQKERQEMEDRQAKEKEDEKARLKAEADAKHAEKEEAQQKETELNDEASDL